MSTCDACKWWEDIRGPAAHHGYCQYFGVCNNPKLNLGQGTDFYVKQEDAGKVLQDGAGASSADETGLVFNTGPKFGCIHHEAK